MKSLEKGWKIELSKLFIFINNFDSEFVHMSKLFKLHNWKTILKFFAALWYWRDTPPVQSDQLCSLAQICRHLSLFLPSSMVWTHASHSSFYFIFLSSSSSRLYKRSVTLLIVALFGWLFLSFCSHFLQHAYESSPHCPVYSWPCSQTLWVWE